MRSMTLGIFAGAGLFAAILVSLIGTVAMLSD